MEIVVSQKSTERSRYSLDRGTITIGSGSGNEIQLASPTVLDQHARVSLYDDNCILQSLAPEGAVFVNDSGTGKASLYDQDVVRIGPYKLVIHGKELVRQPGDVAEVETDAATDQRIEGTFAPFDAERPGPVPAGESEPRTNLMFTGVDLLTGPAKGRRIRFTGKSVKLGMRDESVVAIRPSQNGYMASATNHYLIATLNGKRLTDKPSPLADGDLIVFSELKARFFVD